MENMNGLLNEFFQGDDAAFSRYLADEPVLHEGKRDITMLFDFDATQSRMRKAEPDKLVLGYTRTMMGFLLFQPKPQRIAMIGLGGGSLAKYCLRHLPDTHFTAVEINPGVIALRDKFEIPPDNHNFKVICGDGADYVRDHAESVDVLVVDGFDRSGQPGQLCSAVFYDHCYARLRDGGVLAVNLWDGDEQFDTYTARIRDSFEDQVVIVDTEEQGNNIVFACKGKNFPPAPDVLNGRIQALSPAHAVTLKAGARKIVDGLKRRKPALPSSICHTSSAAATAKSPARR